MEKKYKICISSPPDRDKLVAEIFFNEVQWAEINQEQGFFETEFYPHPSEQHWKIDFSAAMTALHEARIRLENGRHL